MHYAVIDSLLKNEEIYNRKHILTCQLHYAILMKGKKPISAWASNSPENHAEANVLRHVKPKTKVKNASILVVRFNKKGELKLSRPCTVCVNLLNKYGIKKVRYSDENGTIIKAGITKIPHKFSGGYKTDNPNKCHPCQKN